MELTGSQRIRRAQADVWAALNDPAVLQRCIPGCESFEAEDEGGQSYRVVMAIVVGPVKAKFKGRLLLSDVQAPDSYAMTFEGSGGAAGFGKGTARVGLSPAGDDTELAYSAQAQVGGKLAQVGARLIDGVAARMAGEFFTRFRQAIEPDGEAGGEPAGASGDPGAAGGQARAPGPQGGAGVVPDRPDAGRAAPGRWWWGAGLAVLAAGAAWLLYAHG